MAKTTSQGKQLELLVLADINQRSPATPTQVPEKAVGNRTQPPPAVSALEASASDLSVYDAISANYARPTK
jgi:hypothetical protein